MVAVTASATTVANTCATQRTGRSAPRRDTARLPCLATAARWPLPELSDAGAGGAIAESVPRADSVGTTPSEADRLPRVIVVVEGPSGAGKTTWCRTHAGAHALLEAPPDHATVPTEPEANARFWVERNVDRWRQVLERERRDGLVVVDVDPFKL